MRPYLLIAMMTLPFIACSDKSFKKITDRYYLVNLDGGGATTVSYQLGSGNFIGVIPEKVISVGFDEKYIIAKQQQLDSAGKKDYFYILPIAGIDTLHPEEKLIGPLSEREFINKKVELNMSSTIKFSITE